jgi:hypothetical protein
MLVVERAGESSIRWVRQSLQDSGDDLGPADEVFVAWDLEQQRPQGFCVAEHRIGLEAHIRALAAADVPGVRSALISKAGNRLRYEGDRVMTVSTDDPRSHDCLLRNGFSPQGYKEGKVRYVRPL